MSKKTRAIFEADTENKRLLTNYHHDLANLSAKQANYILFSACPQLITPIRFSANYINS